MDIKNHFKGIQFFWKGLKAAKADMWASVQVLLIATVILGILLCIVEPGFKWYDGFLWAFMKYLGNPGKYAPEDPVTSIGRLIWIIISVIQILIFAVPAGLVANGFREAMAKDKKEKKDKENAERIIRSMHTHCSLLKGVRFWPRRWYRFTEIITNLDLDQNEIISAVRNCPNLKFRDLSSWLTTTGGIKPEMMAVEMCYANSCYGYTNLNETNKSSTSKKSNVTIVAPTATVEAGLGYYAYHLARIGGFKVVINEQLSSNADKDENRCLVSGIRDSQYNDEENYPKLHQFVDNIKDSVSSKDNWVILLIAAKTPNDEVTKHQKIHIVLEVDDEEKENTIHDCTGIDAPDRLQAFYDELCSTMKKEHNIEPCIEFKKGKKSALRNYIRNNFEYRPNVIQIELTDDYRVFGSDVKAQWTSIYTMACLIHKHFDNNNRECTCAEWDKDDVKKHRLDLIPRHKDE